MTQPGKVVGTRLLAIRYDLGPDGDPRSELDSITFDVSLDVIDNRGRVVVTDVELHPVDILDLGGAVQAWAFLTPRIAARFMPGGVPS